MFAGARIDGYLEAFANSASELMAINSTPQIKAQRVRDPIHNLIEFDTGQFEQTMWRVVQSQPFQRLRRVKQLGFSEFVFPGATHTRFAHSIGVFHIARQLMSVIEPDRAKRTHQANVALAAALVHDVGHGMFSHAFEDVGKKLGLSMAMHETVSDALIRHSEIGEILRAELGKGFADEVADVIHNKVPGNLFDSVVSSQFDADRLDYMQRDRLMTGVQGSGVDATWILANLEVGTVRASADEESAGEIRTLVLGPKAFYAAEHYVLSLFQLYPNVYLHKTTRGAEKIFSALILRMHALLIDGREGATGLPKGHPVLEFLRDPDQLGKAMSLDDSVFWGSLHFLTKSTDAIVAEYAHRLQNRVLMKCVDIRQQVAARVPMDRPPAPEQRREHDASVTIQVKSIFAELEQWSSDRVKTGGRELLFDAYKRSPYKRYQDSQTPLNQILIRRAEKPEDMAHLSAVVGGAESFEINRVYFDVDDGDARAQVASVIETYSKRKN